MLSAGSIDVSSQNIAVAGSSVVADKDIRLRAQENLTVSVYPPNFVLPLNRVL
ncbi:hypothetical protein [Yersinia pseudotuberculosis]|uniref:hypothetical protein n=1 Tax=Yersinia pseudotuberculosis TaxID=633 RepID=UPI000A791A5D|nr:hypothetical protein [Yersinia pseudotuberculosis]